VPVAEGHCEVPCPAPPALPWRVKQDPNVKTRRIVWNGPGCAKCKPAMSYQKRPRDQNSAVLCETAPRYQNGPVLCKTGFSDKNVAVLCDNGQGPFWRTMSGIIIVNFGTPRPQPLPLSQVPVHKVTEWRTIQ